MKETFYLVKNTENYLELHSENWHCVKFTSYSTIPYKLGRVSEPSPLSKRLKNKKLLCSFDFENFERHDKFTLPDVVRILIPDYYL